VLREWIAASTLFHPDLTSTIEVGPITNEGKSYPEKCLHPNEDKARTVGDPWFRRNIKSKQLYYYSCMII
jgi:hypothetical protein